MKFVICIAVLLTACSTVDFGLPKGSHSPILNSNWDPLVPRQTRADLQTTEAGPKKNPKATPRQTTGVREQLVKAALDQQRRGGNQADYGLHLVQTSIAKTEAKRLGKFDSIYKLVRAARSANAYDADGKPEPGDIVIFHNVGDANGNGENDDWHTGCGIVTDELSDGYQAVVRTGNRPRSVRFWPNGPGVRTLKGERVNSYLRIPHRSDSKQTEYLAGRLYAGHIDIDKFHANYH